MSSTIKRNSDWIFPTEKGEFAPLYCFSEEPPQLFPLMRCWHTRDLTPYSPTHYLLNKTSTYCTSHAAATSLRGCMEHPFIIETYCYENIIGSWYMAILLANSLLLYKPIKKHKRPHMESLHIKACMYNKSILLSSAAAFVICWNRFFFEPRQSWRMFRGLHWISLCESFQCDSLNDRYSLFQHMLFYLTKETYSYYSAAAVTQAIYPTESSTVNVTNFQWWIPFQVLVKMSM